MSDIHIDDFYKDVGLILSLLYNSFPRKTILYVDDITGPDQPDEFGLHSDRFLAGFSTMVWLGDHNYLQYESPIKQEALDQVVLTQRGFLLLSSRSEVRGDDAIIATPSDADQIARTQAAPNDIPPSVMEYSQANITQLRQALASRSSNMIRQCVQSLLRQSH